MKTVKTDYVVQYQDFSIGAGWLYHSVWDSLEDAKQAKHNFKSRMRALNSVEDAQVLKRTIKTNISEELVP
jgi:hypothetical protein